MAGETVKQRLVHYLKYKKIGQNKFERLAGISNGYIANLKYAPKDAILTKILAAAPDLNRVWLLSGVGDMLLPDHGANVVSGVTQGNNSTINNGLFAGCCGTDGELGTIISRYNEEMARLREENERLRKECADKDAERGKLLAMLEKFILGN